MLKPILGIEMNLRTVGQIIFNILVLLLIVILASLVIGKNVGRSKITANNFLYSFKHNALIKIKKCGCSEICSLLQWFVLAEWNEDQGLQNAKTPNFHRNLTFQKTQ